MTVSSAKVLQTTFNTTRALGDKAVSSDAQFVIKGYEDQSLLIKQFPWPLITPAGEIEIPGLLGTMMLQPQQGKTWAQSPVSIFETVNNTAGDMLVEILANGGTFDATVYQGTKDSYTRAAPLYGCFLVLENPDRDWENRSQILTFSGDLFYHFFGYKTAA
ncbi:hypothetical protein [Pseudomonas sp.]|jgi:hypothetical protein|uniref:hypothetical protein n=1 Tax=Pseudomonas sp. TaxID=306 RepID=UPI002EDAECFB